MIKIINKYFTQYSSLNIVGSSVLPFINSPKDTDVVVITDMYKTNPLMISNICKQIRHEHNIDCHVMRKIKTKGIFYDILYAHFHENLYGDELISHDLIPFEELKSVAKEELSRHRTTPYIVYAVVCMCKNQSYELTNDQKIVVNRLHDKSEGYEEDLNNLQEELEVTFND